MAALADILEVDGVVGEDRFRDFEMWDSLSALTLIAFLQEEFGIVIEATDLVDLETVGNLCLFVAQQRHGD